MATETVPMHLVTRMLTLVERGGYDGRRLLREVGISDDVAYNQSARVTLDQLADVTRRVWMLTGDELFGVGPPVPLGTFRLIARSMIGASDLRGLLIRIDQASRVVLGLPRFTAHVDGGLARLDVDVSRLADPDHLVTDVLISFVHRAIGWSIGRRLPLTEIAMPYPAPSYLRYYETTFGRLPRFDADSVSFSFDAALLSTPVLRTDGDIDAFIAASPMNYFSTRDYGSTVADQVRRILEQGLSGEWPSPEDVADRLALSVHHVRRLLREEDTSMTQIREEILRDAAINSLVAGKESVEDLSTRLGFSEASAFRRAFRRWTGMPPGAYRQGAGD